MSVVCCLCGNYVQAQEEIQREIQNDVQIFDIQTLGAKEVVEVLYEDTEFTIDSLFVTKTLFVQMKEASALDVQSEEVGRVKLSEVLYVLSFETESATQATYEMLRSREDVQLVEVDAVTEMATLSIGDETTETTETTEAIVALSDQGFLSYLESQEESDGVEVKIALIDTQVSLESSRVLETIDVLSESTGASETSGADGDIQGISYLENHGTQMADLLINYTNQSVKILPIVAFNEEGNGTVLSAYLGIQEAIEAGVQVINMSFVGAGTSEILQQAIADARSQNIVVIVAAGNEGDWVSNYMPANVEEAITVGAIDEENRYMDYSNYGQGVDVVACGSYLYQDQQLEGTSIAAVYVSATAAALVQKLIEAQGIYTYSEIEESLYRISPTVPEYIGDDSIPLTDIPLDEDLIPPYDYEADMAQALRVSIDLDPYNFYYYTDEGTSVVQEDGNIYWSSASKAATGTTVFDNLYWDVQISNSTGDELVVRIEELDYKIDREEVDGWVYAVFQISKEEIQDMIVDAGYNLGEFSTGTITVEFDGVIVIKKSDEIVEGPYALMYESQFNTFMDKLDQYYFSQESQDAAEEKYKDKITTISGSVLVPTYQWDLNAYLDGVKTTSGMSKWFTCDIYKDGALVANDVSEYVADWIYGTTYIVKDIKPGEGKENGGKSTYSGTVTKDTSVYLYLNSIGYTNVITHYAVVDEEYYNIGETNFEQKHEQTYTISDAYAIDSPNGYILSSEFGTSAIEDKWKMYELPYTVVQCADPMFYSFYYEPITYEISYDMDGGVNVDGNPATYVILDTIQFAEPEKEGYIFLGWYDSATGLEVTGINQGLDTDYESGEVLLQQLANRQTGDMNLVAKWNAPPVLEVADVYMYLENEIDVERIMKDVIAMDEEDGDLLASVVWENSDAVLEELEYYRTVTIEEDTEYIIELQYSVTDSEGARVEVTAELHIYTFYEEIQSTGYVRYIAIDYIDTLDVNSVWRTQEMYQFLENALM